MTRERELISVPICLSKLLELAKTASGHTPNSLERQIGTEIHTLFLSSVLYCLLWLIIHWENQIKHFEVLTPFRSEFKWVTILTTLWTEYRLFNFRYCISMLQNFANGFFADFIKILFHCLSKWSAHVQLKKNILCSRQLFEWQEFSVSSCGILFGVFFFNLDQILW